MNNPDIDSMSRSDLLKYISNFKLTSQIIFFIDPKKIGAYYSDNECTKRVKLPKDTLTIVIPTNHR